MQRNFFLQVGLEQCQGTLTGNKDFLAYWPAIEQTGKTLSRYEQMRCFNRARVALKHDGTLPAQSAVEDFRQIVESFFEENCPHLFGLEFAEISLSGLVVNEPVRTSLRLAEQAIRDSDCKTALEEATKAFRRALSEYRYGRLAEGTRDRLYEPAADLSFSLSSSLRLGFDPFLDNKLARGLTEALQRLVNGLGEAITVVAYNLDYDGYRYLKHFGPAVHAVPGREIFIEWMAEPTKNIEIVSRCVDFAINAALRLQSRQAAPQFGD